MKKIIVAVMALSVMLAFAGCSGMSKIRGSISSEELPEKTRATLGTVNDVEENDPPETQPHETYATETEYEPAVTEAETEASQNDSKFALGVTRGGVYENSFIGIGCDLDSNWTYYSEDEIRQINNIASDVLGDEYEELMKSADIIYDMYAMNKNGTDSINVNMEKIDPLRLLLLDINKNYDALAPEMIELYGEMGYTNISYTLEDVYISGKSFPSMKITAEINGVSAYFLSLSIKCNGYIANISIGTFYTDSIDDILLDFYLT